MNIMLLNHKMVLFFAVLLGLWTPIFGLPKPPTLEELVLNSDYIAKTKLSHVKETPLNSRTISVSAKGELVAVYRKKGESPKTISLAFLVFPEYYGKWLKSAPAEGEYIIFYQTKKIKDSSGKESPIIVLYEPHPFAIREWSQDLEDRINAIVNKEKL